MIELTNTTESGTLTAAKREAELLDYNIKRSAQNIVGEIYNIGKCLKEMNDRALYKELGFDSLGDYAEQAVGLKGRSAYKYISAYETYGEDGLQKYGALGITKLADLAQLNDADREEMLESGKAEEFSTRELQEEIKKLKRQNDQLTFELEEKISSSSSSAEEFTAMQNSLGALVDEYKKLQARAREERAALETEIKELTDMLAEEKKNKVLPAPQMSEAEKEDIRRTIEAETEARHEEDMKELKNAAAEEKAELERKINSLYNEAAKEKLKLSNAEANAKAREQEAEKLRAKLEALETENSRLQANAQKPPMGETKAQIKFLAKGMLDNFNLALKLLDTLEGEEKEGCKRAIKTIAETISGKAEIL